MPDYAKILDGLEENERIYVESRLRGMSKKAALRASGVTGNDNPVTGYDARPHVQEAFRKAHTMSARETGVTRETVSAMLLEAYRNATNAAEQIMAAREIGKLYGLYAAERVEITQKLEQIATEHDLKSLSHEELVRLAGLDKGITIEGQFTELPAMALVTSG